MRQFALGTIKMEGSTDLEKIANFFKSAFPDINLSVTEGYFADSDQTSESEDGDFFDSMERTVAVAAKLSAKVAQRDAVQPVVDEALDILMGDENVKTAVNNLHSKLSEDGKLNKSMENKEEFRKAFLWNVAHAAVKNQARQITADRSGKFRKVKFINFLEPDNSDVRKLVFKGILESEYLEEGQDASADGFVQTPDSHLAAAFDAIGKATRDEGTLESIKQKVNSEEEDGFCHTTNEENLEFFVFKEEWGRNKNFEAIFMDNEKNVFKKIKEKVIATLPNTLDEISRLDVSVELNASWVPKTIGTSNNGDSAASRFTRAVEKTPLEGLFSLHENATEEDANNALSFISKTYLALQCEAKENVAYISKEKFSIKLGSHQIFTADDANQLRGKQGQERTP
jgi:hypothetical protein